MMPSHGLKGEPSNHVHATKNKLLNAFFEDLETFALPRVTRIVRTFVCNEGQDANHDQDLIQETLRESDEDVVELPASFTRRSLCKHFLLSTDGK